TLNDSATIVGRAMAQTGAVTLINDRITAPTTCNAAAVPGPTVTVTPAPAPGGPTSTPTSRSTPTATPAVGGPTPPPAIAGPPDAGGGPAEGGGLPWILAMVAGVPAGTGGVGLAMG